MERLQKVIAYAGVASRRKAEVLITGGKVRVNGVVVRELGTKVGSRDQVEVNGVMLEKEEHEYFLFYKPQKVISTVDDDKNRKTVADFFKHIKKRLYPVGRLDYDTSGLLLVTNDGEFANCLMHPKFQVKKTYIAKVRGSIARDQLNRLERGIDLEDGKTASAQVKLISADRNKGTSIISITIHEGKNRQVRRMFDVLGLPVLKLKRETYSFLTLNGLNAGEFRKLSAKEVKQLRSL